METEIAADHAEVAAAESHDMASLLDFGQSHKLVAESPADKHDRASTLDPSAIASDAARSVSDIGAQLKAGTNCGSCIPELKRLIAQTKFEEAVQASASRPAASAAN